MPRRLVDLSLPIAPGMPRFPTYWHPDVEVEVLGRIPSEGRETRRLVLGTHTGTHLDAPRHFIENGPDVASLPLDTLVGPATVLDFSGLAPGSELGLERLAAALGGDVPQRLILRFDWSSRWQTPAYYVDHPYLSQEAARWLVAEGLRLLAMDTPTPDNPQDGRGTAQDSPVHKIFLSGGVVLVEYLANLASLSRSQVQIIALPLPLTGADGSPIRCVALEED